MGWCSSSDTRAMMSSSVTSFFLSARALKRLRSTEVLWPVNCSRCTRVCVCVSVCVCMHLCMCVCVCDLLGVGGGGLNVIHRLMTIWCGTQCICTHAQSTALKSSKQATRTHLNTSSSSAIPVLYPNALRRVLRAFRPLCLPRTMPVSKGVCV